jgi:hypothetical protein
MNYDAELPEGGHAKQFPSMLKQGLKQVEESKFHMPDMGKSLN